MIIYLIENMLNHKIYIGQTKNLKHRVAEHKSVAKRYAEGKLNFQSKLYPAINKYGFDNFRFQQIDVAITQEELDKAERWWIEIYKSTDRNIGYNCESGGNGPGKFSDERKSKASERIKGENNPMYGKINPFLGKKHSEDTKEKMSVAARNRKKIRERNADGTWR